MSCVCVSVYMSVNVCVLCVRVCMLCVCMCVMCGVYAVCCVCMQPYFNETGEGTGHVEQIRRVPSHNHTVIAERSHIFISYPSFSPSIP